MSSGTTYYVIETDPQDLELAASPGGNAITLDASQASPGTTQTLTPSSGPSAGLPLTFEPSAVEATILDFANPHGLQTGQAVEYTAGSAAIGGLTSGQTYYAIVVGPNQIELAASLADAVAGPALPLDFSKASGTQTFFPIPFSINAATRTIVVSVAGAWPCRKTDRVQLQQYRDRPAPSTDDIIDTTKAYLENANVTTADLDVAADHGGYIGSLTAGAAGAVAATALGSPGGSSNAVVRVGLDRRRPARYRGLRPKRHADPGGRLVDPANESAEIVAIAGIAPMAQRGLRRRDRHQPDRLRPAGRASPP